jgi:hypothetical protein
MKVSRDLDKPRRFKLGSGEYEAQPGEDLFYNRKTGQYELRNAVGGGRSAGRGGLTAEELRDIDEAKEIAEYRKRPDYFGYEDYTPSGRAALKAYNKAAEKAKDSVKPKRAQPYSPSAAKVAQQAQRETASEIQRETRGKAGSASSGKYAKGGSVRGNGCAQRGKTRGTMR